MHLPQRPQLLERHRESAGGRNASYGLLAAGAARKILLMFIRGLWLRLFLGTGRGSVFVGRGVRVRGARLIARNGRLTIEDFAEIQANARHGVTFGEQVSIGAGAMIRPSSYYTGEVGEGLIVGDRSSIGPQCYIGCSGLVTIGTDVMLGPGVYIFAENHIFGEASISIKSQGVAREPVVIEDDCWIASRVTITAGVTIGRGSVIASGSVVTSDIPPHSVAAGVPARVIRSRAESSDNPGTGVGGNGPAS